MKLGSVETPYQKHANKWKNCQLCELCNQRNKTVLLRGSVPCDILFIGEAPGEGENVLGKPFVGPAGKLLDQIVKDSVGSSRCKKCGRPQYETGEGNTCEQGHDNAESLPPYKTAFTNLVACFPKEAKSTNDHRPPEESVEACAPRLKELYQLLKPKLIVCVGAMAKKWIHLSIDEASKKHVIIDIVHPAAILHANVSQRGLMAQKASVAIADAVEEAFFTF